MRWTSSRVSLTMFNNAASVVVLPEPVGPVTRIRPRGLNKSSFTDSGLPICSNVSILLGICRSTMPKFPFSLTTLTRKRAAAFARLLDVFLGRDAAHQFLRTFGRERRPFDAMQRAMHTDRRRRADANVQVRGAFRHHQLQ